MQLPGPMLAAGGCHPPSYAAPNLHVAGPAGPTLERYCRLAAASGVWLSLGGFQEAGPDPGHLYNTQ